MKLLKFLIYLSISGAVLFACKKKGSGSDNPNSQRIKSINDGSQINIFEYDGEGRVTRLYYNASYSLKFVYSPVGVNIQVLGSGDVSDPDRKYDFTIVNGRITTGIEYLPNKLTRHFGYGYDDQGRLIQIYISIKYDGTTSETHNYKLSYNSQNNVQEINFVRKDESSGNGYADSMFIRKTYYDKKFISWGNMGFGYFGVAAVGQRHLGYGITVPFHLAQMYPSNNALKSESSDEYYWNTTTKKWVFQRTTGYTANETDYEYDGDGRLVKIYGRIIEWE